jgi:hypothetical protein
MSDGGKGSKPRPLSVSNLEYATRWDAIFGRDQLSEKAKQERALDEMVRISEEMGLYDEFEDKPTRNNAETQQVQNFKVDNSGKSLL